MIGRNMVNMELLESSERSKIVEKWFDERCEADEFAKSASRDLYASFSAYCKSLGIVNVPSQTVLGVCLAEKIGVARVKSNGRMIYLGLRLKS